MLDEATREAIADQAKLEATAAGLVGDAYWAAVWSQVEAAMLEVGMLPRSWRRRLAGVEAERAQ